MSNYESMPVDTRNIMEDHLHLNDDSKNAVGRLWRLYLIVNTYDIENTELELQNFLNTLQQYIGQPDIMEVAIDQKINDVEREMNGNTFNGGLKKRKTNKKRKRTTRKTTRKRKRSNKRRKTIKGGKDLTALYLNKTFYLRDEIKRQRLEIEQQERQEREEQERREREERRRQHEEAKRRKQEEAEKQRQEEADRIQREKDFWDQF